MSTTTTSEQIRPLSKRRYDWPILIFFLLNLCLITYIVDLEQLVLDCGANVRLERQTASRIIG